MIYLLFAVVIFGAGQLIRKCIESKKELLKRETLIKDKIDIIHMHNKGALLSTFEDKPKLVSSAMLVAIGMLLSIFGQSLMEKNGKIKKFLAWCKDICYYIKALNDVLVAQLDRACAF